MTRGGRPIVVPLDGSAVAEAALSVALEMAALPRVEMTFLQVIERPDQSETEKRRARGYLDSLRSRPEWQVCDVEIVVETGKPAETILEFADQHNAAYIVMSRHGRSGVQHLMYGSVADQVLRAARTTVVLVRV